MRNLALALFAMLAPLGVHAAELPQPTGRVILTVSGAIANTNSGEKAVFDRKMLEDLGLSTLKTSTSWTDGVPTFEGISVARVLEAAGAKGSTVSAVAINDYKAELKVDELRKYPVMLAMKMNGKDLEIRDKGPLWVIYPRDQYAELAGEEHNYKWIWQLKSLVVQ
jgi:hypothetical protein